jgi:hypothetical protein
VRTFLISSVDRTAFLHAPHNLRAALTGSKGIKKEVGETLIVCFYIKSGTRLAAHFDFRRILGGYF